MKIHGFIQVIGGLFKTPCGLYLDGPDKERVEAYSHKVTCGNCKRTHEHRAQVRVARWQRNLYGEPS